MKQKILSLALVLVMCLGLTVPVAAEAYEIRSDKCVYELSTKPLGKTFISLYLMDPETWEETWEYTEEPVEFTVYIVPDNTTISCKTKPEGRMSYGIYEIETDYWFDGFWTEIGKPLLSAQLMNMDLMKMDQDI